MLESMMQDINQHGAKVSIVSISRLQELKQDIETLKNSSCLSGFQNFIVNDIYSFDLPEVDFPIRSVILVASPSPAQTKVVFHRDGKEIPLTLPATYTDGNSITNQISKILRDFLEPRGFHAVNAPGLPCKRLGVRSGLSLYGRNNITYVEGLGSFFILVPFFSDVPCDQDSWREVRIMDQCSNCSACLNNCPTGAISKERFLLYADRCLTNMNESMYGGDFPDWVPLSAHNAIYGCGRCQWICPANREHLNSVGKPVEFSEEETAQLYAGKPAADFSSTLTAKLRSIEMDNYLAVLPRNLKVFFDQIQ